MIAFVEKLLAYLDKNTFPGNEKYRDGLKRIIVEAHCGNFVKLELGEQIENCLCCSTTDGTPAVTPQDCVDCALKFCPQAAAPTKYGSSNSGLPSFCAGFDVTASKTKDCDEFLTGEGPHTCALFTKAPPVQKLAPNLGTMMSNPATSPTGGVRCSVTPPPVPICVSAPGGGAENLCLPAPPL
jgi:hypothetical protein